jgi:hypothetical protein
VTTVGQTWSLLPSRRFAPATPVSAISAPMSKPLMVSTQQDRPHHSPSFPNAIGCHRACGALCHKQAVRSVPTVFVVGGDIDLQGGLLLWQQQQRREDDDPLFCSRKRELSGERRAISRVQAWRIVKEASERNWRAGAGAASVAVQRGRCHGASPPPPPRSCAADDELAARAEAGGLELTANYLRDQWRQGGARADARGGGVVGLSRPGKASQEQADGATPDE